MLQRRPPMIKINHSSRGPGWARTLSKAELVRLCWEDPHKQSTRSELVRRKAEFYKREFGFDFYGSYDHDINNRAANVANGLRSRGARDYFIQTIDVIFVYRRWPSGRVFPNYKSAICYRCHRDLALLDPDLTIDHHVPVSKGGTNNPSNLMPCCRSCNSSKGSKYGRPH